MKIFVTTHPFREFKHKLPFPCEIIYNDKGSKYTQNEVQTKLKEINPDVIIAGTEKYTKAEFELSPNLKAISRVGVGTDSINLDECKLRNIEIFNTGSAPSESVADLTITFILMLSKRIHQQKIWKKTLGKDIRDCIVGIVGHGNIGKDVEKKIKLFNPYSIMCCDINLYGHSFPYINFNSLINKCDILTFHTPELSEQISKKHFEKMKEDVMIVNTARGTLFNEDDLYDFLVNNPKASLATDVYTVEPYSGKLKDLPNVVATPHIGSYTEGTRKKMEEQSIDNIVEYFKIKSMST